MGTRNLSLCKDEKGNIKIAQYGQWDGYPSGQGATILEFCRNKDNLQRLKDSLGKIEWLGVARESNYKLDEYIKAYDKRSQNETLATADRLWYGTFFSRDICGEIFENIVNVDFSQFDVAVRDKIYLQRYDDFDKLENFCDIWIEYAYCINFETNTLDCYGYRKHLKSYDLNNLPNKEDFIKELEGEVEE